MSKIPWDVGAVLLVLAAWVFMAYWLFMAYWYRKIHGRPLRWWAIPLAHGANLFGYRLERFEKAGG